ncbi:MAG: nucleotidyltransferase domain-containing protein [Spirochaetia bacterium]|nr:nucleotidyltransferase domain-containing protein [Spirochaetia bacterium]
MRLSKLEIESIKKIATTTFGNGTQVILFGSRVDDSLKGGDIDLYIKPAEPKNIFQKKNDFLVKLKLQIGDQKIDVVIAKDHSRLIEKEALRKGQIL